MLIEMNKAFEHLRRQIFGLCDEGSSDNFQSAFNKIWGKYTYSNNSW